MPADATRPSTPGADPAGRVEPSEATVKAVAAVIDEHQIPYSIRMTDMVDGVTTYRAEVEGHEPRKFEHYDDASEWVVETKNYDRARKVAVALSRPGPAVGAAGVPSASSVMLTDPNPGITAHASQPVDVDYVNWRGERGERHVIPNRIVFGATKYHPDPQWLMEAYDLDKSAMRVFALLDMRFLDGPMPWPISPDAPAHHGEVTAEGVAEVRAGPAGRGDAGEVEGLARRMYAARPRMIWSPARREMRWEEVSSDVHREFLKDAETAIEALRGPSPEAAADIGQDVAALIASYGSACRRATARALEIEGEDASIARAQRAEDQEAASLAALSAAIAAKDARSAELEAGAGRGDAGGVPDELVALREAARGVLASYDREDLTYKSPRLMAALRRSLALADQHAASRPTPPRDDAVPGPEGEGA